MTGLYVVQTIASLAARNGGPPRTITALSEAEARAGARVTLITAANAAHEPEIHPDPALVRVRRTTGSWRGHDAPLAAAGTIDIIHDNGLWLPCNFAVAAAARRRRVPYVVSPHGMLAPWALAWHRGRKIIAWQAYQRRVLGQSAGLLATAEAERADIRARIKRKPIAVIANGVTLPLVLPGRSARDAHQPRTLLFLSRLHPVKNLAGLIDAWAIIAADPRFADWTLRIAGPDEAGHRADIAAHVERSGLSLRVRIEAAIAEAGKADAFAAADLFVLPSYTENFGIVVAEALAHGVPVVTSHGTPWGDVVAQGCGWWVPADAASLASALAAAMALTPGARRAMGQRGQAWVANNFGWDRIAAQSLRFYEWLIHGGAVPDFVDV